MCFVIDVDYRRCTCEDAADPAAVNAVEAVVVAGVEAKGPTDNATKRVRWRNSEVHWTLW